MHDFSEYLSAHMQLIASLKTPNFIEKVESTIDQIVARLQLGGKILVCGNGGSAADSQHLVAELIGKFNFKRKPIPAISLTVNTSTLTAWSNDESFEDVFARQVNALAQKNDVLIGITTSGRSKNVLSAISAAKELGVYSVCLTGSMKNGGLDAADEILSVASEVTPLIQEAHLVIYHYICARIELHMLKFEGISFAK